MDGLEFVQMIEAELKARKIPKETFYRESGVSSATMSQWRKRIYSPSSAAIKKIEAYLGITFTIEQKEKMPSDAGRREITEEDIKFALFRGREHVTDEMYQEVRNFADYLIQREENKKNKG